jgi:hypothetical protein
VGFWLGEGIAGRVIGSQEPKKSASLRDLPLVQSKRDQWRITIVVSYPPLDAVERLRALAASSVSL